MAKVVYIDPVDHISGKVCKHTKTIFMHRSDTGTNFTSRICRPYRGAPSAGQQSSMDVFKSAISQVQTIMQDSSRLQEMIAGFRNQSRYKTLRGYIFGQVYGKTV